jgi:carbon storage regulator CsrA
MCMLVFSRKKNEAIVIGNNIVLTVVEIRGDKVRLGVVSPKEVPVHRQEVYDAIHGLWPPEPQPLPHPPEEVAFLQAVLESPDDEGIRLIFADWLQDREDPRGEFIRTQCLLAKLAPGDPHRPGLEAAERALWAEHGSTWRGYLPLVLRSAAFRRGFVEAIELTVAEFLAHAGEIFAAAPVRRFRARRGWDGYPGPTLALLAASPYLARLAELDLSDQDLGDGEAALLAASPHAASLNALVLRRNQLGDAGAAALARSPHLTGLARLDLTGNRIGKKGARTLQDCFGGRASW